MRMMTLRKEFYYNCLVAPEKISHMLVEENLGKYKKYIVI